MYAILAALFSSGSRVEILKLFLLNPGSQFYQREIARECDQPIRAVQREVERLKGIELLVRTEEGNRVFYHLNPGFPLLAELTALVQKATGADLVMAPVSSIELPSASPEAPPFSWIQSPVVEPLPEALRRRQVRGGWDQSF